MGQGAKSADELRHRHGSRHTFAANVANDDQRAPVCCGDDLEEIAANLTNSTLKPALVEQAEVDGVRHGSIASILGMQVIATVVQRGELKRINRIAGRLVEVNRSIEDAGRQYPVVDGLAYLFAIVGKVTCAFVRRDGGSEDFDAVLVSSGDELGKPLFEVFSGELVIRTVRVVEATDIVDALKDDNELHSGLRKNISIEAGQRVLPNAMDEDAVAADAFIEHSKMSCCRVVL